MPIWQFTHVIDKWCMGSQQPSHRFIQGHILAGQWHPQWQLQKHNQKLWSFVYIHSRPPCSHLYNQRQHWQSCQKTATALSTVMLSDDRCHVVPLSEDPVLFDEDSIMFTADERDSALEYMHSNLSARIFFTHDGMVHSRVHIGAILYRSAAHTLQAST